MDPLFTLCLFCVVFALFFKTRRRKQQQQRTTRTQTGVTVNISTTPAYSTSSWFPASSSRDTFFVPPSYRSCAPSSTTPAQTHSTFPRTSPIILPYVKSDLSHKKWLENDRTASSGRVDHSSASSSSPSVISIPSYATLFNTNLIASAHFDAAEFFRPLAEFLVSHLTTHQKVSQLRTLVRKIAERFGERDKERKYFKTTKVVKQDLRNNVVQFFSQVLLKEFLQHNKLVTVEKNLVPMQVYLRAKLQSTGIFSFSVIDSGKNEQIIPNVVAMFEAWITLRLPKLKHKVNKRKRECSSSTSTSTSSQAAPDLFPASMVRKSQVKEEGFGVEPAAKRQKQNSAIQPNNNMELDFTTAAVQTSASA